MTAGIPPGYRPEDDEPAQHPRPQLRRRGWVDLCGPWRFAFDDADRGMAERWFDRPADFEDEIVVPFPPESAASGLHRPEPHRVVWYGRTVDVAVEARPARLMLHFGAVDYRASVWVNGRLAVEHEGGHTPFAADIAPLLVEGALQVIVVRAEDDAADLLQPRGKQGWRAEPESIWYHRTTGIWQPVWLEPLPEVAVAALRWTPDLDRIGVGVTVRLNRRPASPLRLRVRLSGDRPTRTLADDTYRIDGAEIRREIRLDGAEVGWSRRHALTWTPDHPRLIDARVELLDEAGAVLDAVDSYFGLRTVEAVDGRFLLNGVPTFLRLVLAQNYWPESHLAAPGPDALRREVELAKSLGFNGLRIHQKIEDPRFLYWCDRLGMMVWGEAPATYAYDDVAVGRLTREWLEAVARDYSHPCIVAWVPLNESWGVPNLDRDPAQRHFVRSLYHATKAVDPTRPVIGNDGWQHAVGDIFGVHDYSFDAATLTHRYGSREALARTLRDVRPAAKPLLLDEHTFVDAPLVISEFGGLSFAPQNARKWFGYGTIAGEADLLERYGALVGALLDSTVVAGFCYTQLTDTEQETNGLLTADRRAKLDPAAVRAITARPAASVPNEIMETILKLEIERRRAIAKE